MHQITDAIFRNLIKKFRGTCVEKGGVKGHGWYGSWKHALFLILVIGPTHLERGLLLKSMT